jgi:hypothetical protein
LIGGSGRRERRAKGTYVLELGPGRAVLCLNEREEPLGRSVARVAVEQLGEVV